MKRTLLLLGCIGLPLLSCDDNKLTDWNNPTDPNGGNYHPPTAVVRADTLFKDSGQVKVIAVGTSINSQIVHYDWKVDNDSTSHASVTDTLLRIQGLRDSSTHLLQARASDANGLTGAWSAPVRIHVWNHPPVLVHQVDTTVAVTKGIVVTLKATDPDGPLPKIFWGTSKGAWTDSSGQIRFSPKAEGVRTIYWAARDSLGKIAVDSFKVTFADTIPSMVHVRDTSLSANSAFSLKLTARNSDSSASRLFWGTANGAWTDSSGTVTLAPKAEGVHKIYWAAKDSIGKTAIDSFTVTFTNKAPALARIKDSSLSINDSLSLKLAAVDIDGLIAKLLWGTTNGTWTDSSGIVTLAPHAVGVHKIYWAARDDLGKMATDSFTVTFTNLPPILTAVRDTVLSARKVDSVTLSAKDPETVVAQYLFDTSGGRWDSSATAPTLRIAGTGGVRLIRWSARDDKGALAVPDTFLVTFMVDTPSVTAMHDTLLSVGKTLSVVPYASESDPAGHVVMYLWSTQTSGWSDSSSTPVLTLRDTVGGTHLVRWAARNDLGILRLDTFVVTFLPKPHIDSVKISALSVWDSVSRTGKATIRGYGEVPNFPKKTLTWSYAVYGSEGEQAQGTTSGAVFTLNNADTSTTWNWVATATDTLGDTALRSGSVKFSYSANGTVAGIKTNAGMKFIPGGTFLMGAPATQWGYNSDETQHSVTVSSFWIDTTPVTQADYKYLIDSVYQSLMGLNPSGHKSCGSNCPVDSITWYDAVLYCNARSKRDGLDTVYSYTSITGTAGNGTTAMAGLSYDLTKNGYRLPTEVEYEYALRGGTTTVFFWGNDTSVSTVGQYAWFWSNSSTTHPVATKLPNPYGLYDMVGNVWEWINDWYGTYSTSAATNPSGPSSGTYRVFRGGSWSNVATYLRSASRASNIPVLRSNSFGFRSVRAGS